MEDIIGVCAFALVASVLALFLKQSKMPVAALLLSLAAGIVVLLMLLPRLQSIFQVLRELAEKTDINYAYLGVIFKLLGIAYICEFAAQLCRDAGEGALSMKIEMGGKVGILLLSLPIMTQILQTVLDLL